MEYNNYNNNFFSYEGFLGRKNYIINSLILIVLFVLISLLRIDVFTQFGTNNIILYLLGFMTGLVKFCLIMALMSNIFRRIQDITKSKSYKIQKIMKNTFVILFVFPLLYLYCIRYFFTIPVISNIIDIITFFVILPFSILFMITISFLKG